MLPRPPISTLFPYTTLFRSGLTEFFQRVLAHSLQQPVSRWATCSFGHDQGLVNQQGEQVEDLEASHVAAAGDRLDRKSTRLNSSHVETSYAVFCLKKKREKA